MAISEAEIETLFRDLGQKLVKVHQPAITSLWSGIQGDLSHATQELIGEDISELQHQIDAIGPAMQRLTSTVAGLGPKLIAHADQLAAGFGEFGSGASGGFRLGPIHVTGLTPGDIFGGVTTINTILGDIAKLKYLDPFGSVEMLDKWVSAAGFLDKFPSWLGGVAGAGRGVMSFVLDHDSLLKLGAFGGVVDKVAGPLGLAVSGVQLGQSIYSIATQGANYNNVSGGLDALGSGLLSIPNPYTMAAGAGIVAGVHISDFLWDKFPNQMEDAHNFLVGIPGDISNAASTGAQDVEHVWNTASNVVSSGAHDVENAGGWVLNHIPNPFNL